MIIAAWIILGIGLLIRIGGWLYYYTQGTPTSFILSIQLLQVAYIAVIFSILLWIYEWYKSWKANSIANVLPSELTNFIKEQTAQGKSIESIKQDLKTQGGWDDIQIEQAFVKALEQNSGNPKNNVWKHIVYGIIISLIAIAVPIWINFNRYDNAEKKLFEAQKHLQEGNKLQAIEVLDEITNEKFISTLSATAHLTKGVLYRNEHLDDEKAKAECSIGLRIDPSVESKDFLNRDSNGNTVADLCRMILKEGASSVSETNNNVQTSETARLIKDKDYRLCVSKDVVGTWEVKYSSVRPGFITDPDDPLLSEFQYFFFNDKGKFSWTVSNGLIDKKMLAIYKGTPPPSSDYSVAEGKITLKQETDLYAQTGLCGIAIQDFELSPGDIVKIGDMLHVFYLNGEFLYLRTMTRSEW